MQKSEARVHYMKLRRELSAAKRLRYSQQITALFFTNSLVANCLSEPTAIVHTYLPIRRQNEIDTWPLVYQLWHDFPSIPVWSSITNVEKHTLRHFQLTPETVLSETKWGIPEPTGLVEFVSGQPSLVIVPLLAFDRQGNRVGYGGGYYDRFLAEAGRDCLKIGLSFFEPVDQINDVEETDVRLDGCVTPENVYLFSNPGDPISCSPIERPVSPR